MAAQAISKPELALLQTVTSLASNPAAPLNIKKDPTVMRRLLENDFQSAWLLNNSPAVAAKAPPTRPAVNAGINKVRHFYEYEKPLCDETVDDCTTAICDVDTATEEQKGYLAVDVANCASKSWTVSVDEFQNLLEAPSQRRADYLRRAAYALLTSANRAIIEDLFASASAYSDTTSSQTAPKNLPIISDKGDILPVAFSRIKSEYRKERFNGNFVTFGGETLATYFDVRDLRLSPEGQMGANANLMNMPFIYDSVFDDVIQEAAEDSLSHLLTVPVGSYFVRIWNQYTGYQNMIDANYVYTTILIDGILFDYSMKFDECDRVWKEMLTLHYGLGAIPDSIYCDGRGMIKHWTASCGTIDCDVLGL